MWTINDVLEGTGGRIEGTLSKESPFDGFSIDTRSIQKNNLFFALSGPHFDGHHFVEKAMQAGARAAVVTHSAFKSEGQKWRRVADTPCFILVEDPLQALQSLATWHRKRFKLPLVGITGSNGKTTTKEMVAAILGQDRVILKTEGNLNNHIGLPLTLLQLNHSHAMAVIEMGINHPEEMTLLCEIAQPTVGLITNIGPAHLEGLGSLEGVAKEKSQLFNAVKTQGTAVINMDDRFLKPWKEQIRNRWTYGINQNPESADMTADELIFENGQTRFRLHENRSKTSISVTLPIPGKHQVSNALAAAAVAASLGLPLEDVSEGLRRFKLLSQRTEIFKTKGLTLLFDAYNANPASVKAALDLLADSPLKKGKRIAILGDMFELGDFSERAHFEIGQYVAAKGIDRLIAIGQYADQIAAGATEAQMNIENISTHADLASTEGILNEWGQAGDFMLIKGSRGMQMERLLPLLEVHASSQRGSA